MILAKKELWSKPRSLEYNRRTEPWHRTVEAEDCDWPGKKSGWGGPNMFEPLGVVEEYQAEWAKPNKIARLGFMLRGNWFPRLWIWPAKPLWHKGIIRNSNWEIGAAGWIDKVDENWLFGFRTNRCFLSRHRFCWHNIFLNFLIKIDAVWIDILTKNLKSKLSLAFC